MRQRQFLQTVERDEAERRFREALGALPELGSEVVPTDDALGRVLAADVQSPVDVPGFDRSNMDGWAVRAADTYGASEHQPRRLVPTAEAVVMGAIPAGEVKPGQAMAIPTGGPVPRGADGVVMVEDTEILDGEGGQVEIRRAVTPGSHITFAGTDIARGETVLRRGAELTSRELGVLAALGLSEVTVRRRPRVAILSTGDELVPLGEPITAGQVYDSNATILAAAVREQGGEPDRLGITPDDVSQLSAVLKRAMATHDVVLLSGGTSKGPGDVNGQALRAVVEPPGIVVHGVALKPGKPLCLAVSGKTPVVVLPGFPTSAIFTFHEFVAPLIGELAGRRRAGLATVTARLPIRFRSAPGRTEYSLVHLVTDEQGELLAYPIGKGSGSVTTWSHADGFFAVPRHVEQLPAGTEVVVRPTGGARPRQPDLVVIGSHCVGLDVLIGLLAAQGFESKVVAVGSEAGLRAAERGACDVAGMHLLDPATECYNRPFIGEGVELLEGYGRLQGVVYRVGDARFEGKDAAEAVRAAVAMEGITMINRNRGSGTRALYDRLLGEARPAGHSVEASSHHAVAAAVEQGRADFGIAIDVVTRGRPLGFLPLTDERFDFAVPRARLKRPAVAAFARLLEDPHTHELLAERGFRR